MSNRFDCELQGQLQHIQVKLGDVLEAAQGARNILTLAQEVESSIYKLPDENCENCRYDMCETHELINKAIRRAKKQKWKNMDVNELAGAIAHACKDYEKRVYGIGRSNIVTTEVAG